MAINISIQEVGSDVVISYSGTANLTGLTASGNATVQASVISQQGYLVIGPIASTSIDQYLFLGAKPSFGTSPTRVYSNSGTGDNFGLYLNNSNFFFPTGYSGGSLSGTSTYNSTTLSTLGLTPGTYTYTWASDSIILNIGISSTTINTSVTQSNVLLTSAISAGTTVEFVIDNPIPYTSYFTLETIPNNVGLYDSSSPKNTSGSFTLDTGQFGLLQSDYIASVIVPSGSTTLTFVPADDIPANTLNLRGIGAIPTGSISI